MNSLAELVAELEPGLIVQIDPAFARDKFGGMFAVVERVFENHVLAYLIDWGSQVTGPIWVRIPLDKFRPTGGRVQWKPTEI